MANLTLAIDDELLKRARVQAAEQGTSVNAEVRNFLGQWVSRAEENLLASRRLLEIAAQAQASSDGSGFFTREEVNDRAALRL